MRDYSDLRSACVYLLRVLRDEPLADFGEVPDLAMEAYFELQAWLKESGEDLSLEDRDPLEGVDDW